MEPVTTPIETSPPAAPIVEAAPVAPAAPVMAAPPPMPAPKVGFFSGITVTDVGMIALASLSFFMIIYYYRNKITYIKKEQAQMKKDVEELKANVQTALGPDYKSF